MANINKEHELNRTFTDCSGFRGTDDKSANILITAKLIEKLSSMLKKDGRGAYQIDRFQAKVNGFEKAVFKRLVNNIGKYVS